MLLIDYGRTPGLVLPSGDGGYDRWVYGDWNYYALGNTGLHRGLMALFLPTQGALGREQYGPEVTLDEVAARIHRDSQHLYTFQVAQVDATKLQQRLESSFTAAIDTRTRRPGTRLDFVHYPDTYSYFNNSNHVTARWLRELGCRTRGLSFSSRWEIRREPVNR